MGLESDYEIAQLICNDDQSMANDFAPSLQECANEGVVFHLMSSAFLLTLQKKLKKKKIFTQLEALEYIGTKIRMARRMFPSRKPKVEEAREILSSVILAHIPVQHFKYARSPPFPLKKKIFFLASASSTSLLRSWCAECSRRCTIPAKSTIATTMATSALSCTLHVVSIFFPPL